METRLKAYGGDRAKNLESIADEIDKTTQGDNVGIFLLKEELRQLRGHAEQLRIIANELRKDQ